MKLTLIAEARSILLKSAPFLQPRYDYQRRLSCTQLSWRIVPYMGNQSIEGVYSKRLCYERWTIETSYTWNCLQEYVTSAIVKKVSYCRGWRFMPSVSIMPTSGNDTAVLQNRTKQDVLLGFLDIRTVARIHLWTCRCREWFYGAYNEVMSYAYKIWSGIAKNYLTHEAIKSLNRVLLFYWTP